MEKIPTAEEILNDKVYITKDGIEDVHDSLSTVADVMIEFAKLHVEQALKEASESAIINKNKGQVTGREFGNVTDGSYSINQPSILNSYSLYNIK